MTIELERRAFVQAGVALAAGAAVAAAVTPAAAQTASPAPAAPKPMTFDVKPMPFDPGEIKGLSEKISPAITPTTTPARSNGSTKSPSSSLGSITPRRPDT